MSEVVALNKFYEGLLSLFPFPLPQCRDSVDLSTCFKSYAKSSDVTKVFLDKLVAARHRLLRSMMDGVGFEERLGAVEAYLPVIQSLAQSWADQNQTQRLKLDREHIFEWRLYLHGRPELYRSNDIVFDIIMCYHWKAICHHYLAREMLSSSGITPGLLADAAKQVLLAASVMDLIATQIQSNSWLRRFSLSVPNPAETSATVCSGLSSYFKACGQAMATVKAMMESDSFALPGQNTTNSEATKKTSATVRARLALAVVSHDKNALHALTHSNTTLSKLSQWYNEKHFWYISAQRDLFEALARYLLAQQHLESTELGLCIATCQQASLYLIISPKSDYNAVGLPPHTDLFTYLNQVSPFLSSKITLLRSSAERDNNSIHFQRIPDVTALPPLPSMAAIMLPTALSLPELEKVPFVVPQKLGFMSTFFGTSRTSSSTDTATTPVAQDPTMMPVPPAASVGVAPLPPFAAPIVSANMPTPPQNTDEVYARQLQQQFDREANASLGLPLPSAPPV